MGRRITHNYIHIPKTGGTAMKYVVKEHNTDPDKTSPKITIPSAGHNQNLNNISNACFIIRHPWDRFCSGFWERVTMPQRKTLSHTAYKNVAGFGYKEFDEREKQILDQCETPDQYLTYIRTNGLNPGATPGLFELTASICHWLGDLNQFKQNEHKISMVYHINNLDKVMKEVYQIELPQDPFRKRSRQLFDMPQSYSISPQNKVWFEREFRKQDYELIAYIKTRPYYYE